MSIRIKVEVEEQVASGAKAIIRLDLDPQTLETSLDVNEPNCPKGSFKVKVLSIEQME